MQFYVLSRKETSKNKCLKEYPEGDKMKVKQLGTLQKFEILSWVISE